jgi:putative photosynthetic complex assembly protein 2
VADFALPVLYALFLWWFSTGLVLYLDGLPRRSHRWSMAAATVVLVASLAGLVLTGKDTTVTGAYLAFTCGLLVWGWQEMSFLLGYVTGPRQIACPPGATGWVKLGHAVRTVLYHELAIALGAVVVLALTWNAENQVGAWTYMILWVMRISAKLNVYLGVPNLADQFLPEHLQYLKSYLVKRPINLLFPLSVTGGSLAVLLLVQQAVAPGSTGFDVAGFTFLAALMALAILEHWFLILPLPDAALWSWALQSREVRPATASPAAKATSCPLPATGRA